MRNTGIDKKKKKKKGSERGSDGITLTTRKRDSIGNKERNFQALILACMHII